MRTGKAGTVTPEAALPKSSFRERQKQLREREIIAVAAALLGSKGYAGMNLDDVADEVFGHLHERCRR